MTGRTLFHFILLLFLFLFAFAQLAFPFHHQKPRGIAPEDEKYYSGATIWCKDSSRSLPADRINDGFCDCPDGSDEPGTSACPEGKFYCENHGHTPFRIFSSRVNDGICDCCDGSDEYEEKVKCSNTCWEAGKERRKKLEKRISIIKEGIEIRKRDIEQTKIAIQKDRTDLSSLKQEEKILKDIVQKLKVKKEAIEEEERRERAKRDEEERREREKRDEEKKREEERHAAEVKEAEKQAAENLATNKKEEESQVADDEATVVNAQEDIRDTSETVSEGEQTTESMVEDAGQDNLEDISKEELGRRIAARWTGEDPTIQSKEFSEVDQSDEMEMDEQGYDHEDEDMPEEDNEPESDSDDEEISDDDSGNSPSETVAHSPVEEVVPHSHAPWWHLKLQGFLNSVVRAVKPWKVPVDVSEAKAVRKQYDESSSKLRGIQSRISDLEKKLEQDFGREGEFYVLYDRCFEMKDQKYVYKVCPYKNGVQLEGRSTVTLGNWDGFKDDYTSMLFVRGERCWNGPDRSVKVKLRCGTKLELRDVDEPSRCEYAAELSTPAACLQERLNYMQQELKKTKPPGHEEL